MLCVLWKIDMFSSYFNTDLYNFTLWVGDFIFVTLRYVFPFKSASLEVFIAPGVEGIHTWVLEHWKRQISFKTSVSSVSPSQFSPCLFCQSMSLCSSILRLLYLSTCLFALRLSIVWFPWLPMTFWRKFHLFYYQKLIFKLLIDSIWRFYVLFISASLHASSSLFLQWVSPCGSRKTTVDDLIILSWQWH